MGGGQNQVTQGKLSEGTRQREQYRSMNAYELRDLLLEGLPPDGSTLGGSPSNLAKHGGLVVNFML